MAYAGIPSAAVREMELQEGPVLAEGMAPRRVLVQEKETDGKPVCPEELYKQNSICCSWTWPDQKGERLRLGHY